MKPWQVNFTGCFKKKTLASPKLLRVVCKNIFCCVLFWIRTFRFKTWPLVIKKDYMFYFLSANGLRTSQNLMWTETKMVKMHTYLHKYVLH
jgi:hypothetical protein